MRAAEIMRRYGIKPDKALGQHFLVDKNIIKKEVELAEVSKDDVVLEIGAGFGMLTEALVGVAKKVVAVEKDVALANILRQEFEDEVKAGKLEVVEGDALLVDFPPFDKCVSNIPYNIASEIVEKLCHYAKDTTLCVQKDFGERLVAKPGDKNYSRISVLVRFHFEPYYIYTVSRFCFIPTPKVDSCIVRLIPKKERVVGDEEKEGFFNMIRALFVHRKKSVKNAFIASRGMASLKKDEAKKVFEAVPYGDKKVFRLSVEELAELFEWCKGQKLNFSKTNG